MKKIILIICGVVLFFTANNSFADCIACTKSYGVKITLNNEKVKTGYITWNHFSYEGLLGFFKRNNLENDKAVLKNFVYGKTWENNKELFAIWVKLVNYMKLKNKAFPEWYKEIMLYGKLEKIQYPFKRYVGVEGSTETVLWSEVKKIEIESSLSINEDSTGMDILSVKDIIMLQNPPNYYISDDTGMGSTSYLVYSDKVPVEEVLLRVFSNPNGGIYFNKIEISDFAFGGFSVACSDKLGKYQENCLKFSKILQKYSDEKTEKYSQCMYEYDKTIFKLKKNTTDYKSPYNAPKSRKKYEECRKILNSIKNKYGLKESSREELRKLGIITFSYAWD
jgi:hypothetical protein